MQTFSPVLCGPAQMPAEKCRAAHIARAVQQGRVGTPDEVGHSVARRSPRPGAAHWWDTADDQHVSVHTSLRQAGGILRCSEVRQKC